MAWTFPVHQYRHTMMASMFVRFMFGGFGKLGSSPLRTAYPTKIFWPEIGNVRSSHCLGRRSQERRPDRNLTHVSEPYAFASSFFVNRFSVRIIMKMTNAMIRKSSED